MHRAGRTRLTWMARLALAGFTWVILVQTSDRWTAAVGRGLVCQAHSSPSDAILIENFGTDYLLFEQARNLRQAGLAPRVLIPTPVDPRTKQPSDVDVGFTEVMARISGLGPYEIVPTEEKEPISLNVARDVLHFVERTRIQSVIVVSPLFRSRRSAIVYNAVLGRAGVRTSCVTAPDPAIATLWPKTLHGVQDVVEQWVKLLYYQWIVLL